MLKKCLALLMLLVTLAAPLMAQADLNVAASGAEPVPW